MLITTCCTNSKLCLAEIKYAALRVKSELPLRLSRKEEKKPSHPPDSILFLYQQSAGTIAVSFHNGKHVKHIVYHFAFLPSSCQLAGQDAQTDAYPWTATNGRSSPLCF